MQTDARSHTPIHIRMHALGGGYDTRHERAELVLLGAALLTIVSVLLLSISTLLTQ